MREIDGSVTVTVRVAELVGTKPGRVAETITLPAAMPSRLRASERSQNQTPPGQSSSRFQP